MRILVLGTGKIGSAILSDLAKSNEVSEIVAGDIDAERAKRSAASLRSKKVSAKKIDATDHGELVRVMKQDFDVVTDALTRQYNLGVARAATEARVDYVNMSSPKHIVTPELNASSKAAGVTLLPGCGLDPGIDAVLEGHAAGRLDKVEKIHMWCGGFPQRNVTTGPLRYKIAWSWETAVYTYLGKANILRNGRIVEVEKLTGPGNPETIGFPEPVGECEAFYTGAPLFLIEDLGLKYVEEAWEKTVRFPGHCEIWTKLLAMGLASDEPLKVKGSEITPREFLVELGERTLQYKPGEGDVAVIRVEVIGEKDGEKTRYLYDLVDFYDEDTRTTAMARTTGYTCSIISQMVARGDIREKGIVTPGKIGLDTQLAEKLFRELAKRNIRINETVTKPVC